MSEQSIASDRRRRLLILAGDGVGPEVTAQARRVIDWFVRERGLDVAIEEHPYSVDAYRTHGTILPAETRAAYLAADAILFGASGGPDYEAIPAAERASGDLLHLRRARDLFINLRPIAASPALADVSPLKARIIDGADLVIVRELTAGIYFGTPRGIETLADGDRRGVNTHSYTGEQIRRIARFAFELARTRRGHVCSVEKSNVMEAGLLWREEVQAVHDSEYADVRLTHMLADNCAFQLVRAPTQFDVILTDNLFGDLLSDCGAPIAASLGMMASASLGPVGPDGVRPALYEPIHGSAPDIAGQGIANPIAAIRSVAMALRLSFGRPEDAALLDAAIEDALRGGARTADIREPHLPVIGCQAMADAILAQLDR